MPVASAKKELTQVKMRLFHGSKLAMRVTLLVALALFFIVGGFAYMGYQTVRESTERTLQERLVMAQVTAERADELLQRTTVLFELVMEEVTFEPDRPALAENRESLQHTYEHLAELALYVALVDRGGTVVLSEPEVEGLVGSDVSTGRCIQKVLAGGPPMITKVFTLGQANPSAAVLVGVKDREGEVSGLVYVAINLEHPSIVKLLQPIGLGETGYAEIVDQNGIILASTWPEHLWQKGDHGDRFSTLIEEGRTTVGTCHECHSSGGVEQKREDVMAFAPLSTAPWGVAVRQSEAEALAYSYLMKRRVLTFGGGAFLVAVAFTWIATGSLVKPLQKLVQACRWIAAGELGRPIPPMGTGEISTLAHSFDTMRQKLKASLEEIEQWNLDLEQKVAQRTEALEMAEQERRELLHKLVAAQEEERRRLARELHDETSQTLTALTVGLETALLAPAESAEEVKERLVPIKSLAVEMLQEVQRIILDLRPSILDDLGLVQAIDWYAESRLKPQAVSVSLEIAGEEKRLPSEVETAIFRMAQEAISNISKHARAENVNITLDFKDAVVALAVEDDGCGFDPEAEIGPGKIHTSFGLLGIRERAAFFGGVMGVQSLPGHGTRIAVEIPLEWLEWNGKNGQEDTSLAGGRPRYFERRIERPAQPV